MDFAKASGRATGRFDLEWLIQKPVFWRQNLSECSAMSWQYIEDIATLWTVLPHYL